MTYDVQKYDTATAIHQTDCDEWVKASEAEAHEKAAVDEAYKRGYADAEKYFTNSCFECGYAGEWSTWTCDDCLGKAKPYGPGHSLYDSEGIATEEEVSFLLKVLKGENNA